MRIISPFRDYYDSAATHGVDTSLVYVRRPVGHRTAIHHLAHAPMHGELVPYGESVPDVRELTAPVARSWGREDFAAVPVVIGFCGTLHPAVHLQVVGSSGRERHTTAYSSHEIARFVTRFPGLRHFAADFDDPARKGKGTRHGLRRWVADTFFAGEGLGALAEVFCAQRAPVFVVELFPRFAPGENHHRVLLSLHRRLSDFEFYRVHDPFRAFQEVAMFLGGVLGREARPTVAISDRDMAVKKGFDAKTSFRAVSPGARKLRRQTRHCRATA